MLIAETVERDRRTAPALTELRHVLVVPPDNTRLEAKGGRFFTEPMLPLGDARNPYALNSPDAAETVDGYLSLMRVPLMNERRAVATLPFSREFSLASGFSDDAVIHESVKCLLVPFNVRSGVVNLDLYYPTVDWAEGQNDFEELPAGRLAFGSYGQGLHLVDLAGVLATPDVIRRFQDVAVRRS